MPFENADIAYLSGLFEGEGTIRVDSSYWDRKGNRKARNTVQRKLRISMTDLEPLQRVASTVGGRINGPYQYGSSKTTGKEYKKFWVLDIDNSKLLEEVVHAMCAYLSPRRQEQLAHAFFQ